MIKIENFDRYYVTKNGEVISVKNDKTIRRKTYITKNGYEIVKLAKKGKYVRKLVHRLVAEAYIPNFTNNLEVNHIDGNKLNNSLSNIELVTHYQNMKHAHQNKLIDKHKKAIVEFDGYKFHFNSYKDAAKCIGVAASQVSIAISKNRLVKGKYKITNNG